MSVVSLGQMGDSDERGLSSYRFVRNNPSFTRGMFEEGNSGAAGDAVGL